MYLSQIAASVTRWHGFARPSRQFSGARPRRRLSLPAVALSATSLSLTLLPVLVTSPAGAVATPWQVLISYPSSEAVLSDIACPSPTDCIAVGDAVDSSNSSNAVILATTDAGSTWAAQTVPSSLGTGFDTSLISVTCPSAAECFAFGYSAALGDVILATTNGGANWAVQDTIDALGGTPDITCASTSECFALTDGDGGSAPSTILETTNGGAAWSNLPLPANLPQLSAMTCTSVQDCFVVGGADVLETTNGGTSWTTERLGGDPPGQASLFSLSSVACVSSTTCIAVGGDGAQAATAGGVVFTTTNGGAAWTGQNVPVADLQSIACTSTLDCFASGFQGYGGLVLGTLNAGASWTAQVIPAANSVGALSCPAANTCFTLEGTTTNSSILEGPGAPLSLTTTNISVSPTSVPPGQGVTYSAHVQPTAGTGVPTGTVTFSDGSVTLCTANLTNGAGSCSSTNTQIGTDSITGVYSGDAQYATSTGSATQIVEAGTMTLVGVDSASVAPGQDVTYLATVSGSPDVGTPTGSVTFSVGTTSLCIATLTDGAGSCSSGKAPLGADVVTGTYSGDEYFAGSSGTHPLSVGATSTAVTVAPSSVPFQQSVTYSATVAPTIGTGTPTGSVTFTAGNSTLCVAALAGGTGTCSSTNAPLAGEDTIVGAYSGDESFAASVGSTELAVGATNTTVVLQPGSVAPGGSVEYTADVIAPARGGTPTGTVTFTIGGVTTCRGAADAGSASCSSSSAPVGNDEVDASYSGDGQFAASTGSGTLAVGPTTTTVAVSPSVAASRQVVTYSATVTSALGSDSPTGSVDFSVNGYLYCIATLSSGAASCTAYAGPVGTDTVTGAYSGDAGDASSFGTETVSVDGSTTTASVQPDSVVAGQDVTYSAEVVPSPGFGPPTGTVLFNAGGTNTCVASVVNGTASCSAVNAPAGNDTVTATYSGDGTIGASTGFTSLFVGATTTSVSMTPYSVPAGEDTSYSATVSGTLGGGVPTGTVAFSYDGYLLCTASLSGGTGSCTTVSDGGVGQDTVVGTYSGDKNFAGSSGSAVLTETKNASVTSFSSFVDYGQIVIFNANVEPSDYGGSVTFSVGSATLCTATYVLSLGQYSCTSTNVPWGDDTITATYSGDANYSGSSSTQPLVLGQPTVTTVSASSVHAAPGQSVTYQVSVAGPGASTVPTGNVTVTVGSTNLCVATLSGGAGSCSATSAGAGAYAVAGTYSGDTSFGTSLGWTTLVVGDESQAGGSIAMTKITALIGNYPEKVSGNGWAVNGDTSVTVNQCASTTYSAASCDAANQVSATLGKAGTTAGVFKNALIKLAVGTIDSNGDTCGVAGSVPCYIVVVGNIGDETSSATLGFSTPKFVVSKSTAIPNDTDPIKASGLPIGDTIVAQECDANVSPLSNVSTNCDPLTDIHGTVSATGGLLLSVGIMLLAGGAYSDSANGTCPAGGTCEIVLTDSQDPAIGLSLPVHFVSPLAIVKKGTGVANGYVDNVKGSNFPIGDTVTATECDSNVTPADAMLNCDNNTQITGTVVANGKVIFNAAGVTVLDGSSYSDGAGGSVNPGGTVDIVVTDSTHSGYYVAVPLGLAG